MTEADDVGTAEEADRAHAASAYYDLFSKAGVKDALQISIQMVGGELPTGYEWDKLEIEEPEDEPPAQEETPDMEDEPEPAETVKSMLDGMSLDALKELQIWRKKCLQAVKHLNPPASVPFEVRAVPAQVADAIRAVLTDATDEDGVKRAFDLTARDVEYKEPAAPPQASAATAMATATAGTVRETAMATPAATAPTGVAAATDTRPARSR